MFLNSYTSTVALMIAIGAKCKYYPIQFNEFHAQEFVCLYVCVCVSLHKLRFEHKKVLKNPFMFQSSVTYKKKKVSKQCLSFKLM